jgi:hypothetical protein
VRWCAWIIKGRSPFIAAHGCCGAGWWSTMARLLRRAVELGEVVAVFYGSWRCYWRRQLGRGGPGWVALLPGMSRQWRDLLPRLRRWRSRVWSWPCLAASWWRGDAQRLASGARASARWWRGACPVRVHGAHGRDASGMLAILGARRPGVVELLLDQGGARRR